LSASCPGGEKKGKKRGRSSATEYFSRDPKKKKEEETEGPLTHLAKSKGKGKGRAPARRGEKERRNRRSFQAFRAVFPGGKKKREGRFRSKKERGKTGDP